MAGEFQFQGEKKTPVKGGGFLAPYKCSTAGVRPTKGGGTLVL